MGRSGEYIKELLVDCREESKTLAWSSVALAFKNAIVYEGIVPKPKALGDISGVSYIYSLFYRFGLIKVPEKTRISMRRNDSNSRLHEAFAASKDELIKAENEVGGHWYNKDLLVILFYSIIICA